MAIDKNTEVSEYAFENFSKSNVNSAGDVSDYSFLDFTKDGVINNTKHEDQIRIEKRFAKEKNFEISPVVKRFRGLKKQEDSEIEQKIEHEIVIRLEKVKTEAYKNGLTQGKEDGKRLIMEELSLEIDDKLSLVTDLITETLNYKVAIFKEEKQKLYHLIRNLTKWVTLKELKNDDDYLNRLLEKLINEIDSKSNLLIQTNKQYFEKMPDVLEIIEKKLGKLDNVRMELDYDIEGPGLMLSSNNSLIDGTITEQFNNLDKLFSPVGLSIEPENSEIINNSFQEDVPEVENLENNESDLIIENGTDESEK